MSESIAVLITSFNRREVTLRCLAQVEAQVLPSCARLTVYVADDRSSDGTADAIRRQFPDAVVLEGSGSLFWAGGMRLADSAAWPADPDYLLWLNDDVSLSRHAVAELVDAARQRSNRAIVVGPVSDPTTGLISYGGYTRAMPGRWPMWVERVSPTGELENLDTMNGNVVLVPAQIRASIGPPDPSFSHNMADMDYGYRANQLGWEVILAPDFVGTCGLNRGKAVWRDPSVSLVQRLQSVMSPKGLPPREWWTFTRRHCGWRWPRYFLSPYVRALLGRWAK